MVVAAVIEQGGQVLIGQRKQDQRHPLKWEFPGGKVERGESPREALRRELEEELGIRATIGREIVRYEFAYPRRRPILLLFYRVRSFTGVLANRIFEQIRWEKPERLPDYDFLDGDLDFINRLSRGEYR
jgi:8-oxo-dGTP diphosphatase